MHERTTLCVLKKAPDFKTQPMTVFPAIQSKTANRESRGLVPPTNGNA